MNRHHNHLVSATCGALFLTTLTPMLVANTIAYWRFEGDGVTTPTDGAFVQDTDGRTAVQAAGVPVPDVSGNGNNLYTWNNDGSGHVYHPALANAPFLAVPQTGETNSWYIENVGGYPASFTWSAQSTPGAVDVETWTSSAWTIEASVRFDSLGGHHTFVGRDGNHVATGDDNLAPLYFKVTPESLPQILYTDAAGIVHDATAVNPVVTGKWYHFAATCDGTTLKLWQKEAGDIFQEVASTDVSASADSSLVNPGVDVNGDTWAWTIGRGRWGPSTDPTQEHVDRLYGAIDEVRISDQALTPDLFLAAIPPSAEDSDGDGMADWWEYTYFLGLDQTPGGDYDGDHASNLSEFENNTVPIDESSWPDTDFDGMNDGWEMFYFPNLQPSSLALAPDDDADGDHNSNLTEFLAGTDPTSADSYPDDDSDGMNDGWELFHFPEIGTIVGVFPEDDFDGDLYSNLEEFNAGTDPMNQVSSPDSDDDGLPDGWEVKYFRLSSEDLATVITYQSGSDDPDGDGFNNKLEQVSGTNPNDPGSFETVLGYWRFEEATSGEVPAGGNGDWAFPTSILDSSAYGNHMMTYADYTAPNHDSVVPGPTVPATGADNTGSLFFERNANGVYFIETAFSTGTWLLGPATGGEATLPNVVFDEFTVEASFNTTLDNTIAGDWQVPVAKFGNPVSGQPPFSIKIGPDNHIRAGLVDGSGTAVEIIGTTTVTTSTWYSVAVTVSDTEMKLWVKSPGSADYQLDGTVAVAGAWYVPVEGPLDDVWSIGAGQWNGITTDAFQGNVDEVRISAVVLPESGFLFAGAAVSAFQAWAEANIPDPAQRGENDDPDGDGTINIIEQLLGLSPMDGSSFFKAILTGANLYWTAADGLQFTIQRSTSLTTWDDVDTVMATGETAFWTDPAPPLGKAFYRVVLATP